LKRDINEKSLAEEEGRLLVEQQNHERNMEER
jgi:hypothetical protein